MIGDEVMQSGPADEFGRRKLGGIGDVTADEIRRRTGRKVIYPVSYTHLRAHET